MALMVRDRKFYRSFASLTAMIALKNVIVYSVNLADNVMLGAYSETAMSGVALANQIQFLLQMIVTGTCDGVVVMASRCWGARDLDGVKGVSAIGMRVAMLIALALGLAVFFLPGPILWLLTDETPVIAQGSAYLKIICFSYLFFAFTNILVSTMQSVESVRVGFYISLTSLIFNICLNLLLIFGLTVNGRVIVPEMGVQGAAIATLISRIAESIVAALYVFRVDRRLRLKLSDLLRMDRKLFRTYLRVGMPMMISGSTWGIAQGVQTSILGHMGAAAIGANSIAASAFGVISVFCYGSANAASVIIGKTIGEQDTNRAKQYAKSLQILFLGVGLASGALLFALRGGILAFYDVTPETRSLALQFLTVLSITVVGTSYQVPCLCGIVRGGGQTSFVLYNDLIFMWLVVLPAAFLCGYVFHLPALVVFICLKSDQVLKCFVAVVKVNFTRWIRAFDTNQRAQSHQQAESSASSR